MGAVRFRVLTFQLFWDLPQAKENDLTHTKSCFKSLYSNAFKHFYIMQKGREIKQFILTICPIGRITFHSSSSLFLEIGFWVRISLVDLPIIANVFWASKPFVFGSTIYQGEFKKNAYLCFETSKTTNFQRSLRCGKIFLRANPVNLCLNLTFRLKFLKSWKTPTFSQPFILRHIGVER